MSQGRDCLGCAACCALFRVSFHCAETDDAPGGSIPMALTEQIMQRRRAMTGTAITPARCIVLAGSSGVAVISTIYEGPPRLCRKFERGWLQCRKARRAHGVGEPLPSPRVASGL